MSAYSRPKFKNVSLYNRMHLSVEENEQFSLIASNVGFLFTYFDADAADVGLLASGIRQQDVLRF